MVSETSKFGKNGNFDSLQKSEKISEIYNIDSGKIKKILAGKKHIEERLKVKLSINKNILEIRGDEVDLYTASQVIKAIERNFPVPIALLLAEPEFLLEDLNIKMITKKKNLEVVRARIIGTEGKTLQTLETLSECKIALNDNILSIIGPAEKMKDIINALKNLVSGSKQANVYKYLEKARTRNLPDNLDLKIKKE